jgi:hypothetical protein
MKHYKIIQEHSYLFSNHTFQILKAVILLSNFLACDFLSYL